MKRWIAGLCVLTIVALGVAVWSVQPWRQAVYTDGDTIREASETARLREILWQPPVALPAGINTGADDYEPRVSRDGLTLFFVRGKAGENADIYFCERSGDGWSDPQPLAAVNSDHDDLGPAPSPDGSALYFYSNRPGGHGGYDLWVARARPEGWSNVGSPINLGAQVNSSFNDYGPAPSPDGMTLYFASNRPKSSAEVFHLSGEAWPATLREDFERRDYDLYSVPISGSGLGRATALAAVNTPYNEGAPAVTPHGDFLYFASDRPEGFGGYDLYRSRRLRGGHQAPTNLGVGVNTPAHELDPALTLGGFTLYFSSDRPIDDSTPGRSEESNYDLYSTSSREVFRELETAEARTDWGGVWPRVGPNLLWGLLALLLLLLILLLMRPAAARRLSLLTKCLLASLMVHLLLMFLFNFWKVTVSLAETWRRRPGIKVALISSQQGDSPAAQIRGHLTDVSAPPPPELAIAHFEVALPSLPAPPAAALTVERAAVSENQPLPMNPTAAEAPSPPPELPPQHEQVRLPETAALAELALPAEPDRQRVEESEPAFELAEHDRLHESRPPIAQVIPSSSESKFEAVTAPVEQAAAASPQSLVEPPTTPKDAIPEASAPSQPMVEIVLESAPPPNIALPDAALAGAGEVDESAPALAVSEIRPPRAATHTWSAIDTARAGLTAQPIDGPPLVAEASDSLVSVPAATDAPVASRPLTATREPSVSVEVPSLPAVALPDETATRVGPVAEDRPRMLARALDLPRSPVDANGPAARTSPSIKALEPTMASRVPVKSYPMITSLPDSSLASISERNGSPASPSLPEPPIDLAVAVGPAIDLPLPAEQAAVDHAYAHRRDDIRPLVLERLGGSDSTERAVALALEWLAKHQSRDGRWDGTRFDQGCGQCGGRARADVDVAVTGLAVLAMLGADHTPTKDGVYREHVDRGIGWLLSQQRHDGDLRGRETMYSHGIATIALAEAYGMTGQARLADPIERGVRFIVRARSRHGGWRYDPGQAGDTSVLGWQVMALRSAELAEIAVPADAYRAAAEWLDRVEHPSLPGRYGYRPGRQFTPAMTAEGMFSQQLLGVSREERRMHASARHLLHHLPNWRSQANTYYWYYATLALFHHQGPEWKQWNDRLVKELLDHQHQSGPAAGSWPPHGQWAQTGGRVYQTTMCTLMLEIYYRYLPLYSAHQETAPLRAGGAIRDTTER